MKTKITTFIYNHAHILIPLLIAVLTLITHGSNLFGWPYFENDEGVYTSQGWWLVHFGKLAPYTYWYDHSPLGWLQIGLWQQLTGGPFAFGFSLYSTRILMMIVAVITNILVYAITVRITDDRRLGFLASLFMIFSPLAIKFHRRVLLDNIQTLWLLVSIFLLLDPRRRLSRYWMSGIAFGLSFLSKEMTVFLLPAFLYGVWKRSEGYHRGYALASWTVVSLFLISLFPLMALLRGEFFPTGWIDTREHVSLIETVQFQADRGRGLPVWHYNSELREDLRNWTREGPVFIQLGLIALMGNVLLIRRSLEKRIIVLISLCTLAFYARGGLVLDFYVVPFLPLLAFNIALLTHDIMERYSRHERLAGVARNLTGSVFIALALLMIRHNPEVYIGDQTSHQLAGVEYIEENLDYWQFIVIDNFAFMDLRLPSKAGDKVFPDADWFYKVDRDPEIREDKLAEDWRNIDYILLSDEMVARMGDGRLPFLVEAYRHTEKVKDFGGSALLKVEPGLEVAEVQPIREP